MKELIKIEVNKTVNRKITDKIKKIKCWLFKKVKKIDRPLAKLTKKERENSQNYWNQK